MLALTPKRHFFPLVFYYGASGLALGAFDADPDSLEIDRLKGTVNFNPFFYGECELESLRKSFLSALKRVPPSDFYGVYRGDLGNYLLGLKGGRVISLDLLGNSDASFVEDLYRFMS